MTNPIARLRARTAFGREGAVHPEQHWTAAPVPPAFKRYSGVGYRALPTELLRGEFAARAVLTGRVAAARPLDDISLSTLLFLGFGVTRGYRTRTGAPVWFRAAMSAGNRHPIECYVLARNGLFHYAPLLHRLELLASGTTENSGDGALLILTAIPWRTCQRYGARGYRHCYWDAGTCLANLLVAADSLGIPASAEAAFADQEIADLLRLDDGELPIALVQLGTERVDPADPGLSSATITAASTPSVATPPEGFSDLLVDLRAGALSASEVVGFRDALRRSSLAVEQTPEPLEDGPDVVATILRRGSPRHFAIRPIPDVVVEELSKVLGSKTALDVALHGDHLRHVVHAHALDDSEPSRFELGMDRAVRTQVPSLREQSQHLALDQQLAAEASLMLLHGADLNALAVAGARSLLVAELEAGVAAGRVALYAAASGLGSTALTMTDALAFEVMPDGVEPLLISAIGQRMNAPPAAGAPGEPKLLARVSVDI